MKCALQSILFHVLFALRVISAKDDEPQVFLTVSSLVSKSGNSFTERQLEMNWYGGEASGNDQDDDDWIGLFTHRPTGDIHNPVLKIFPKNHIDGYHRTDIQLERFQFSPQNLSDDCISHHIVYVSNNKAVSSSCLRARPHWMWENKDIIGPRSLVHVMLPGTHDAGSYMYYDPKNDGLTYKYVYTQEENIFQQLAYGIRFFDFRAAYSEVKGQEHKFWITHGAFLTPNPIVEVLRDVKDFLSATKEIVIIDFHNFPVGFGDGKEEERHRGLIELILNEVGDYMVPNSFNPFSTFDNIWESGRRLIVGYASTYASLSNYLHPAVHHHWGNQDNLTGLEKYFNNTMCQVPNNRLNSAMAELTATPAGIIFDRYGGLRKMAHNVNRHVTQWFRDRWWRCANIVATDYFLGNDMINVAIESNRRR